MNSPSNPPQKLLADLHAMTRYLRAHPPEDENLRTFLVGLLNSLTDYAYRSDPSRPWEVED